MMRGVARQGRDRAIGTPTGATQGLWVPPGVVEEETIDITRLGPGNMARRAAFAFRHGYKLYRVYVYHDEDTSRAEIEDKAAAAWERRLLALKEQEVKRPPTPEERKEIGRIMNDIRAHMLKRRESSNGKIWYEGISAPMVTVVGE